MTERPTCQSCRARPCVLNHRNKDGTSSYKRLCSRCRTRKYRQRDDNALAMTIRANLRDELREQVQNEVAEENNILRRELAMSEVANKRLVRHQETLMEKVAHLNNQIIDVTFDAEGAKEIADKWQHRLVELQEKHAAVDDATTKRIHQLTTQLQEEEAKVRKWMMASGSCFVALLTTVALSVAGCV